MTDTWRQIQQQHNQRSASDWDLFAAHRQIVTSLLLSQQQQPTDTLCIWGAGNANDLALAALLRHFAEVHLVDLDPQALAIAAQQPEISGNPLPPSNLCFHAGMDLAGLQSADVTDVQAFIESLQSYQPPLPREFQVVASTCLLSQLHDGVRFRLGDGHARLAEAILAVRDNHLRAITRSLAPAGRGLLITDVVSSDTWPELLTLPEANLPQQLSRQIEQRNFFTGLNPFALLARFQTDPWLREQAREAQLSPPWSWRLGPRAYAVCPIKFRRC